MCVCGGFYSLIINVLVAVFVFSAENWLIYFVHNFHHIRMCAVSYFNFRIHIGFHVWSKQPLKSDAKAFDGIVFIFVSCIIELNIYLRFWIKYSYGDVINGVQPFCNFKCEIYSLRLSKRQSWVSFYNHQTAETNKSNQSNLRCTDTEKYIFNGCPNGCDKIVVSFICALSFYLLFIQKTFAQLQMACT